MMERDSFNHTFKHSLCFEAIPCPWDKWIQMMRPLRFNVIPLKMKHFNLEISSLGVSNLEAFTSQSVFSWLQPKRIYKFVRWKRKPKPFACWWKHGMKASFPKNNNITSIFDLRFHFLYLFHFWLSTASFFPELPKSGGPMIWFEKGLRKGYYTHEN